MLCSDCHLIAQGRRPVQQHHVAGLRRGPTLTIPANRHCLLSDRQQDWPRRLRLRPRSPSHELEAYLRGLVEVIDEFDGWPGATFTPPPDEHVLTVPLAAAPGLAYVMGTDRSWHRPTLTALWRPCPLPYPLIAPEHES
jgi:hypothetical protein